MKQSPSLEAIQYYYPHFIEKLSSLLCSVGSNLNQMNLVQND